MTRGPRPSRAHRSLGHVLCRGLLEKGNGGTGGAGSSDLLTLTFPDFGSLTRGPAYGGPHLSVTQSQSPLSQRIPFRDRSSAHLGLD
jgi:hypothetical protein